jgi:hypothetical protein
LPTAAVDVGDGQPIGVERVPAYANILTPVPAEPCG